MNDTNAPQRAVILADGDFPSHPIPCAALADAQILVCCDDAVRHLLNGDHHPDKTTRIQVVGDLDSMPPQLRNNLPYPVHHESEQDYNDLTKAMRWLLANTSEPLHITILGATGLREDHTLGNISLLMDYYDMLLQQRPDSSVIMVSDYGTFTPVRGERTFSAFPRQQVSIFSLTPDIPVTLHGLHYPLHQQRITRWWQATLNSALANTFTVKGGDLIVYQTHKAKGIS